MHCEMPNIEAHPCCLRPPLTAINGESPSGCVVAFEGRAMSGLALQSLRTGWPGPRIAGPYVLAASNRRKLARKPWADLFPQGSSRLLGALGLSARALPTLAPCPVQTT